MTSSTSENQPTKVKRAGLNRLHKLRYAVIDLVRWYYRRFWGMNLHPGCQFSLSTKFDKTWPRGIHVDDGTYIAFGVRILSHDMPRGLFTDTKIGKNCFVGGCSIIMPGVEIGDECIIGAGSVVTKSIPPRSIVAGNPAKILRSGVPLSLYGRLPEANATEAETANALEEE